MMNRVDFFIVGAPKCGTTSLHHYLRQHPEIYLPETKDRPYFGEDIYPDLNQKEHQDLYTRPKDKRMTGESCVWYLYSKTALDEIKFHNPQAKIIIMLRNPVDMLYSLHSELLYAHVEDEKDFEKALKLEKKRKAYDKANNYDYWGRRFIYYSDVAKFSDQIKRYLDKFGKENIWIIIFDDFVKDTKEIYQKTLEFLGTKDSQFTPDFERHNPNKQVYSQGLQRFIAQPPDALRKLVHAVLPYKTRYALVVFFLKLNTFYQSRPKMSADLRQRLIKKFKPEIKKLEKLLKINLSAWSS